MVPVKRYDVTLTLDDILTPLKETASQLARAGQREPTLAAALDPQIVLHLQRFTELVTELSEVVARINQVDPNLLASKRGPPPVA
jgi:hypothetical protein